MERRNYDPKLCEVYAQAPDHSVVGERTVEVPAGETGVVTVEAQITTERQAVTALLRSCEVAGSSAEGDG